MCWKARRAREKKARGTRVVEPPGVVRAGGCMVRVLCLGGLGLGREVVMGDVCDAMGVVSGVAWRGVDCCDPFLPLFGKHIYLGCVLVYKYY